jgi:hypothetical protein
MSGRGGGFCALKIPQGSSGPVTGFAGRAAWPVEPAGEADSELAQVQTQISQLQVMLQALQRRIEHLEVAQKPSKRRVMT